jgi:hypothetical protein
MTVEERMHDLLEAAGRDIEPSAAAPAARVLRRIARHRRRITVLGVAAVMIALAVIGSVVTRLLPNSRSSQTSTLSIQPESLLARPLHLPSLAPGATCPATPGTRIDNSYFGGVALGDGPVQVLLADRGDLLHGEVDLGATQKLLSATQRSKESGWSAIQTLWLGTPGYDGPFVVRGADLEGSGSIEVQPDSSGEAHGSGPLVVPAGPTINSGDGYRTVPGSTWVTAPGCYAWQVDGNGFSDVIVVNVQSPKRG